MTKTMSILSFLLSLLPSSKADPAIATPPRLDIDREIRAIAAAENSAGRIGPNGERGRLQFTATRWYQFSVKPHRWAGWRHPFAIAETERVERKHVEDLINQCQMMRLVPTPYTIALLHAAGIHAVQTHNVGAMKKDFATRAETMYELSVAPGKEHARD